jgi:hypothetical protein
MTPLQKGKATTDYTNCTDFSLEEIRVIRDSAAKTTNDTNFTNCTTEEIRAICEIRGSCSEAIRVIRGRFSFLQWRLHGPGPPDN